jgi:hypothetical protein
MSPSNEKRIVSFQNYPCNYLLIRVFCLSREVAFSATVAIIRQLILNLARKKAGRRRERMEPLLAPMSQGTGSYWREPRKMLTRSKVTNGYAQAFGDLYEKTPKAVFAAIVYSFVSIGDDLSRYEAVQNFLEEWGMLFETGIVDQPAPAGRRLSESVLHLVPRLAVERS